MKKKVLFIITKSNWGGAQRYVYDLSSSLPEAHFDVAVALGGTGQADALRGTLDSKLRAAGIRTIFIPSFMRDISLRREFLALGELVETIRDEKPDVVHLNSSKAGGLGALAARRARWPVPEGMLRAKIVFTVHGLPHTDGKNIFWRMGAWLGTWLTFLLCDTVIVISHDNYARASRMPLCGHKVKLVHNGLDVLNFMPQEAARQALGLAADTPRIGSIANLEWNKGLHYFVRAAGILKRQGKHFAAYIIGEGEERKFLEALLEEEDVADVVTLLGFREEAWKYLPAFDLFALPSLKEGLPYVALEAGQAGVPVVGSRIPGIAEIIGDKVSGLLYRPKDARDLAEKLGRLLDQPGLRQKLGQALQARVTSEFSLEKMVSETTALY